MPIPTEQKISHFQRLIVALAEDIGPMAMAQLVTKEFHQTLKAASTATYLTTDDAHFELAFEIGFESEIKEDCGTLPISRFMRNGRLLSETNTFFGSAEAFAQKCPEFARLLQKSNHSLLGYSILVTANKPIGLILFTYDRDILTPLDISFVTLFADLCSQALERSRLSENERNASHAKSQFLANISHEVRNPLSLIHGYTELLSDASLNPEQTSWNNIIHRKTQQVLELIDDVLDISRIEANKIDIKPSSINLTHLAKEVEVALKPNAEQKGLKLDVVCQNLPAKLCSDPKRIRQIMHNLIDNAIKFTHQGSIRMELRMADPDIIIGTIVDTGIGIAPAYQQKIFEPFTQIDNKTSRLQGGTGLGLAISRALAQAMGGDLTLDRSAPNDGAVFTFTLDCKKTKCPKPERRLQLEGLKILVVDDSEDNRAMFSHILKAHGAEVSLSANGADAIQSTMNSSFDIILMDIQMPEIDGYEAASILRTQGYQKPILALSASAMPKDRVKSLESGFDEHLTKPIEMKTLIETLRRFADLKIS